MNILTIITTYPPAIGGAQLHTHQIMRRLAERHCVQVASMWDTPRNDWLLGTTLRAPLHPRRYTQDGVPVQQISLTLAQRAAICPWVLGYYAIKRQAIRRIAALLAPQIDAAMPDVDVVHCARIGREPLAFAALQVARARGVPFILAPYHHPRWIGWNYHPLHELYRAADRVLALTNAERDLLLKIGVQGNRIVVIGAAANVTVAGDEDAFRQRYRLADAPVVLFLGQKLPYKGFDRLLKAAPQVWRAHPETRFIFIGPRTRASRKTFAHAHDPRIIEIDTVTEREKADALAACTVFCLPSSQESFGMVYTEAWHARKPVIGLAIPALREVITDDVDGYLVQPDDGEMLASRISLLLCDASLRTAMGYAGYTKTHTHFSWERVAAATESAYTALV